MEAVLLACALLGVGVWYFRRGNGTIDLHKTTVRRPVIRFAMPSPRHKYTQTQYQDSPSTSISDLSDFSFNLEFFNLNKEEECEENPTNGLIELCETAGITTGAGDESSTQPSNLSPPKRC